MTKRKDAGAKLAAEADALAPVAKLIQAQIRVKPGDGDDSHELVSVRVFEMDIETALQASNVFRPVRDQFVSSVTFATFAAQHSVVVCDFLGLAIGWPPERVARLSTGGFFRVAAAVFEANPDFSFLLGPADFAPKATHLANGAGETASASSKSADTPTASATP